MTDFARVFGLDTNPPSESFRVEVLNSSLSSNILWPGDRVRFTLKVTNQTGAPLNIFGKL